MYVIERFGTITLSPYNNDFTLSPVAVKSSLLQTAAGVFDNDGEGRSKHSFPFPVSYDCLIAENVYNNNRGALDGLRAAVGMRARLYRRALNDDNVQWCMARLIAMPHTWPYSQRGRFSITLDFQQLTPWQGADHAGWRFDDGFLLDDALDFDPDEYRVLMSTAMAQTVNNGGNLPTSDVTFTVTTAFNPLSNIVISVPGISTLFTGFLPTYTPGSNIRWLGTIPNLSQLKIDCGARSVTLNGENAYGGFLLGSGHVHEEWMILAAGNNTVTIEAFGTVTGASWAVNFRDIWA